jgi:hypothetical protein
VDSCVHLHLAEAHCVTGRSCVSWTVVSQSERHTVSSIGNGSSCGVACRQGVTLHSGSQSWESGAPACFAALICSRASHSPQEIVDESWPVKNVHVSR